MPGTRTSVSASDTWRCPLRNVSPSITLTAPGKSDSARGAPNTCTESSVVASAPRSCACGAVICKASAAPTSEWGREGRFMRPILANAVSA